MGHHDMTTTDNGVNVQALGKPVELHVIDAPYGHDCFLLEEARQTPLIRTFLTGSAS